MPRFKQASKSSDKRIPMSSNSDLISYLLLLRFGNVNNKSKLSPKISYSSIAKLVKISIESVRRLISKGINDLKKKQEIQSPSRKKLSEEHTKFLCSQQTLNAWAHLSLQ
jgi:hypothetical protein